jgi:hypothetical protein
MRRRQIKRITEILSGLPDGATIINIEIHQVVNNQEKTQWIQESSLKVDQNFTKDENDH